MIADSSISSAGSVLFCFLQLFFGSTTTEKKKLDGRCTAAHDVFFVVLASRKEEIWETGRFEKESFETQEVTKGRRVTVITTILVRNWF